MQKTKQIYVFLFSGLMYADNTPRARPSYVTLSPSGRYTYVEHARNTSRGRYHHAINTLSIFRKKSNTLGIR
jgi:hypothetical protein